MSESPTEHFEHAEHAEHIAHSGDSYLARVSITIAVLAVIAATVGSLESIETAETISSKTTAAIRQNKATDEWGIFSRQSTKKTLYDIAADTATGDKIEAYKAKSKKYEADSQKTQENAEALEKQVHEDNEASEHHEHRHQILTIGATLLHISIAIATIAIVMRRRRWPYHASIGLGIAGLIAAVLAYV